MQNAFKKAPVSSAPAGPSGAEHNSVVEDWNSIKDEDKTLVHQVRLPCVLKFPMISPTTMQDLLDLTELFLASAYHVLDCSLPLRP